MGAFFCKGVDSIAHAESQDLIPTTTRLGHEKVEAAPKIQPLRRICQDAHDICDEGRQVTKDDGRSDQRKNHNAEFSRLNLDSSETALLHATGMKYSSLGGV